MGLSNTTKTRVLQAPLLLPLAGALGVLAAHATAPSAARACGGGFGVGYEIEPDQTLVLTHEDGVETYLFRPSFCGTAEDFGLILPIPGALVEDPVLADELLFDELADLTAPRVEVEEVCRADATGATGAAGADSMGGPRGVSVISTGSVGIFDWVQLDADSASAFTDWLDERSFPYEDEAMGAFEHYVDAGWKFVAFTVDAAEAAGVTGAMQPGAQLCGDFGPIQLAFGAETPVVPLRIAASDADSLDRIFTWRVYAIAKEKLAPAGIDIYRDEPASGSREATASGGGGADFIQAEERYARPLDADALRSAPTFAALAAEGDWVTELELSFQGRAADDDLYLEAAAEQDEFQRVIHRTEYVDCPAGKGPARGSSGTASGSGGGDAGCAATGASPSSGGWWLLIALAFVRRKRARAGRGG